MSVEPLPSPGSWRTEVGRFRATQPRRRFPLGLHVGAPAGDRVSAQVPWPVPDCHDVGLRFDLLSALVEVRAAGAEKECFGWLTRPGVPRLHDVDLQWYAVARRAFAAHGVDLLGYRAVTRTGWVDVASGVSREWRRLRL